MTQEMFLLSLENQDIAMLLTSYSSLLTNNLKWLVNSIWSGWESHHKWPTPGWDNSFFTYLGILILEPEMAVPYGDEKSYPFLLYFAAFFVKMTCKQSFLWLKLPCTVV